MKKLLLCCAIILFVGIADLPSGYYTLLRIAVTIGALGLIITEFEKGVSFWLILYGFIAIVFNPIIPIYLYDKDSWLVIDLIVGLLFLVKSYRYTG